MSRKPIVAMSWAMRQNKNADAIDFSKELGILLKKNHGIEQIVFPSMGTIQAAAPILLEAGIGVGSQNIAPFASGQYSGEYSIESLIDVHGEYVELGHWERRSMFGDTDELINQKLLLAIDSKVTPILCIGENERVEEEALYKVLKKQLFIDLFGIEAQHCQKIIVAYTPQWAVGQSRASNAPRIHQVSRMIREIISELYDELAANSLRIIYGGSVSPENAGSIVNDEAIDGVLVGRFGSKPERFAEVVHKVAEKKIIE